MESITDAVTRGDVEAVRGLLDAGARVNVLGGPSRGSLLSLAAWHGHVEVARLLLERGAVLYEDDMLVWPLMFAARQGHNEMVRLLLEYGDEGLTPERAFPPMFIAAVKRNREIPEIFKEAMERKWGPMDLSRPYPPPGWQPVEDDDRWGDVPEDDDE